MLTPEEVERLSIDLFMMRNADVVEDMIASQRNNLIVSELPDSIGLNLAYLYIQYIQEMDSNDN